MFQLFLKKPHNFKDDVLSGLTVALALVPEAVAFAFVAGVDPIIGLYAAFFVGFITAAFGGRPGMISGATGAMAVVMTAFVTLYGIEHLFAAVVLTGIIQILAGVFKLGKFIRLLPHPVMLGFVNGLAIVIGLAQFGQLKTNHKVLFDEVHQTFSVVGEWMSFSSPALWSFLALIGITMFISQFLPKLTKAIPAPLVAIVLCTLLSQFVPALNSKTVTDVVDTQRLYAKQKQIKQAQFDEIKDGLTIANISTKGHEIAAEDIPEDQLADVEKGLSAGLPSFHIPQLDWSDFGALKAIFILAITLASIGLIESLMTLSLIDEITETRGQGNRECMGQGLANIVTGFFGGMGGCAMIGQSMININSGGRGRTSGMSAALFLLGFILFAPGLIAMIPIASLVGVMFMVVIATFEWSSLRLFGKIPASDIFVVIVVSAVTVILDLAIAVGIGIVISALVFAWTSAKELRLSKTVDKDGTCTYLLYGHIFFGSITSFRDLFNPSEDPDLVIIDFKYSKVFDHSGIEALQGLGEKYKSLGKEVRFRHLSKECNQLLIKAGNIIEVDFSEDPSYHVADDRLA